MSWGRATGRARAVGRIFAETGREVGRKAREAHDALVLLKHRGDNIESEQGHAAHTGTIFVGPDGQPQPVLSVEVCAAADLGASRSGEVDAYCVLYLCAADGRTSKGGAAACQAEREAKTPVILRQRSPRWGSVCNLPVPDVLAFQHLELVVRVMNAGAMQADSVLGEGRIPLDGGEPFGATTLRLKGGGYASLSLRWSVTAAANTVRASASTSPSRLQRNATSESADIGRVGGHPSDASPVAAIPRGSSSGGSADVEHDTAASRELAPENVPCTDAFEEAMAFWEQHWQHPAAAMEELVMRLLCAATAVEDVAGGSSQSQEMSWNSGINEMLLQAPLTSLFCMSHAGTGGGGASPVLFGDLLTALATVVHAGELLTPLVRSRLIGALLDRQCKVGAAARGGQGEALLCDLFCATKGEALYELKRLVDAAGTDRDLRHVVFSAVTDPANRDRLLAHLTEEAHLFQHRPVHVLSDIDMTIWVGNFGRGGPKFPQGPVPGATSLFDALGGRVAFLSARPPVWEGRTRRMLLDDIGIAEAVVLPGSLKAVLQTLVQPEQARVAMGERKVEVFGQYALLHPEARFVFFGDSGEADVDFAASFMADGTGASLARERRDRAALIHDVVLPDGVSPKTAASRRAELRLGGVLVFDSYVGAAVELHRLGFLDADGLRAAASGCCREFGEIDPSEFSFPEVFRAREEELLRDLQAVNTALREAASEDADVLSPCVGGAGPDAAIKRVGSDAESQVADVGPASADTPSLGGRDVVTEPTEQGTPGGLVLEPSTDSGVVSPVSSSLVGKADEAVPAGMVDSMASAPAAVLEPAAGPAAMREQDADSAELAGESDDAE